MQKYSKQAIDTVKEIIEERKNDILSNNFQDLFDYVLDKYYSTNHDGWMIIHCLIDSLLEVNINFLEYMKRIDVAILSSSSEDTCWNEIHLKKDQKIIHKNPEGANNYCVKHLIIDSDSVNAETDAAITCLADADIVTLTNGDIFNLEYIDGEIGTLELSKNQKTPVYIDLYSTYYDNIGKIKYDGDLDPYDLILKPIISIIDDQIIFDDLSDEELTIEEQRKQCINRLNHCKDIEIIVKGKSYNPKDPSIVDRYYKNYSEETV